MAFHLINKTWTWLEVEIGDSIRTISPRAMSGSIEESEITDDVRRKVANGSLVLIAAGTVTVYPDKPVDSIAVDLTILPPDDPDPQSDNEDKDVE
jgi:hypothetical protein